MKSKVYFFFSLLCLMTFFATSHAAKWVDINYWEDANKNFILIKQDVEKIALDIKDPGTTTAAHIASKISRIAPGKLTPFATDTANIYTPTLQKVNDPATKAPAIDTINKTLSDLTKAITNVEKEIKDKKILMTDLKTEHVHTKLLALVTDLNTARTLFATEKQIKENKEGKFTGVNAAISSLTIFAKNIETPGSGDTLLDTKINQTLASKPDLRDLYDGIMLKIQTGGGLGGGGKGGFELPKVADVKEAGGDEIKEANKALAVFTDELKKTPTTRKQIEDFGALAKQSGTILAAVGGGVAGEVTKEVKAQLPLAITAADIPTKVTQAITAADIPTKVTQAITTADIPGKVTTEIGTKLPLAITAADIPTKVTQAITAADIPTKVTQAITTADIPGKVTTEIGTKLPAAIVTADIPGKVTQAIVDADIPARVAHAANTSIVLGTAVGAAEAARNLAITAKNAAEAAASDLNVVAVGTDLQGTKAIVRVSGVINDLKDSLKKIADALS